MRTISCYIISYYIICHKTYMVHIFECLFVWCYVKLYRVPSHGSRFLRLSAANASECHSPPPAPRPSCPQGFTPNKQRGFWQNTDPCPGNKPGCAHDDGVTVVACARKCNQTAAGGCVAFELFQPGGKGSCFLFHKTLEPPFEVNAQSLTCLKNSEWEGRCIVVCRLRLCVRMCI